MNHISLPNNIHMATALRFQCQRSGISLDKPLVASGTKLNDLAQQQGSLTEQMFDVIAVCNAYGLRDVAVWLTVMFLKADRDLLCCDKDNATAQLPAATILASHIGCQDAVYWLREQSQIRYDGRGENMTAAA